MKTIKIVSGIRATGNLHVGNYLGAMKQFLHLQDDPKNECYFFIADLHALTTPFEPDELRKNTLEVVTDYLSAGINPEKTRFFLQSQVKEHTELAWIFNCILPLAELERMTQYKDKAEQHKSNINAGLLTYPTLMASDILVYKAEGVPVGEDQVQHVELTRIVARKFNNRFGNLFPEPTTHERKPLRIMSLKDPSKKMSKTADQPIYLADSPETIKAKLKKAVTATDSKNESPGVDNLMLMLKHFGKDEQIKYFKEAREKNTLQFSELKETLASEISETFQTFRENKANLEKTPEYLAEVLSEGAKKARQEASKTLMEVKEKIGLL